MNQTFPPTSAPRLAVSAPGRMFHGRKQPVRGSAGFQSAVSQVSNLPGDALVATTSRLEIGAPADWKSALRAGGRHFRTRGYGLSALVTALLLCGGLTVTAGPPKLPALTSVSGNPRLPGKFVWADLVTDNSLVAQKFYGDLFGWKFYDYGGYFVGYCQDRPLCGIFQRPRPKDRVATPRWFGYISVSNVEKAQLAVTQAGGRVLAEPKKMPKRGEQAVFADAEGAMFGVVKSSAGDPEDFLAEPGEWIWIQLLSRDAQKAAEFYRTVIGYEVVENTKTNGLSDYILTSEGFARGTVRTIRTADTKVQPTWLPFVRVKNVAESVALAKQLGGTVLFEPKPELLDGKVAVVADPTGAAMGIMEWHENLMKGER